MKGIHLNCHPERSEGSAVFHNFNRLKGLFLTVVATIREIFDEAPYARFLQSNGLTASAESYRAFLRDHQLATARRPRCC